MPALNAIIEGIVRRLNAHASRHQDGGADEIILTGLSGVPTVTTNTIYYEDEVVSNGDEVVYNE